MAEGNEEENFSYYFFWIFFPSYYEGDDVDDDMEGKKCVVGNTLSFFWEGLTCRQKQINLFFLDIHEIFWDL